LSLPQFHPATVQLLISWSSTVRTEESSFSGYSDQKFYLWSIFRTRRVLAKYSASSSQTCNHI